MLNIKYLTSALVILFTMGCGGGDGGGSSSASTPSVEPLTIDKLEVSYDNNLASTYNLNVSVELPALSNGTTFISICDNSSAAGDLAKIDYNQCLIKSSLNGGMASYQLTVANHNSELIAVVWPLKQNSSPMTFTFERTNLSEEEWHIQ